MLWKGRKNETKKEKRKKGRKEEKNGWLCAGIDVQFPTRTGIYIRHDDHIDSGVFTASYILSIEGSLIEDKEDGAGS
jgi:hypothetical protein